MQTAEQALSEVEQQVLAETRPALQQAGFPAASAAPAVFVAEHADLDDMKTPGADEFDDPPSPVYDASASPVHAAPVENPFERFLWYIGVGGALGAAAGAALFAMI